MQTDHHLPHAVNTSLPFQVSKGNVVSTSRHADKGCWVQSSPVLLYFRSLAVLGGARKAARFPGFSHVHTCFTATEASPTVNLERRTCTVSNAGNKMLIKNARRRRQKSREGAAFGVVCTEKVLWEKCRLQLRGLLVFAAAVDRLAVAAQQHIRGTVQRKCSHPLVCYCC